MKNKFLFQVFLAAFFVSPVIGQNVDSLTKTAISDSSYKSFRLFEDENLVEISLRFDLSTYFRAKPKKDYIKANITFHLSKTDSVSKDIRLKTRGIFRNSYCAFAPIELNFKKADFGYADLNSISKIKLVNECKSGGENESYILREYLTYKLFNVLTDTSFRVRLLKISYIDTEKKRKTIRQFGFFIEPIEMMTARTNTIQVKSNTLTQKSIVPKVMDRLAIFNYMIGNYDWAVPGQHNIKVLKSLVIDTVPLGIAIPYDFDWTGLVNPTYAIPAEIVGTQTVRERIFQGVCRSREVYQKDLEIFLKKKEKFYSIINEFPYLTQRDKKDIISYLDEFYNQFIGNRDFVGYLLDTCKKF